MIGAFAAQIAERKRREREAARRRAEAARRFGMMKRAQHMAKRGWTKTKLSYRQIGKAYQRSLNAFKEKLTISGVSAREAAKQRKAVLQNGKIPSATAVISNYKAQAARIRAAANEIEDEKKMGYQDAPLPKKPSYVVPDMSWKRDDIHAMEEYLDNKKEAAAWTDIEVMRAKWNHVVTPRPWTWQINNHFAVSIMPFDATPARPRPDFLKRLGTSLGVTGAAFDFVEAIQIFIPGPDEDATAFADLGVTLVSSFSLGETYLLERPHPDLPMMVAVNQDVLITAGDAFLALGAKGVGTAVGGPLGYAMGLGTDLITTGTSLPYDISRVFGTTPNYITAGISVSPETFGDVNIVVWPQK